MSRLADARAVLADALAPTLPGRVGAYPPGSGQFNAPRVWVGVPDTQPATIGQATAVTLALFPVFVAYDGAVHAQVAGIDDLLSAVIDAVGACPGFEADGSRSTTIPDIPAGSTIRVVAVTATATITARTLCPPGQTTVTVPPAPLTVGGP